MLVLIMTLGQFVVVQMGFDYKGSLVAVLVERMGCIVIPYIRIGLWVFICFVLTFSLRKRTLRASTSSNVKLTQVLLLQLIAEKAKLAK